MVFRHYDYFITIVEVGSLSKAAEKLFVSQPSLSQYLKKLETSLDVELFDHTTSPLQLTFAGEKYYQAALQLRQLEENTQKELKDISDQVSGRLRLGIAFWRSACMLPEIFPLFHEKYPNIELELLEGRSIQMRSALMEGKIDVAVMNLSKVLNTTDLTSVSIFEEKILLAVPSNHPEYLKYVNTKKNHTNPLFLLKRIPLLSTKPGQNLTTIVNYVLSKNNIEANVILETGNLTTAINLVATGLGCAFVPEEGASVCVHPGFVTYLTINDPDLKWMLSIVHRKDAYVNSIAQLFINTALEIWNKR